MRGRLLRRRPRTNWAKEGALSCPRALRALPVRPPTRGLPMTTMSTERRVAVITGASQGIGAGLVRGFLDRGYRVVANSRSINPVASGDMLAIGGDIPDPGAPDRVISGAVETFGRVDTLVNNAGIFISKSFTDYTE